MNEEIKSKAIEIIANLSAEIYQDLAKPGVQNIGKVLGTVLGTLVAVTSPLEYFNEAAPNWVKRNFAKLGSKIQQIPPENAGEIRLEIGVPVIGKLQITESEKIADLYINLLVSAADIKKDNWVHPGFINLISNLSTDEAKIIEIIHRDNGMPFGYLRNKFRTHFSDHFVYTTTLETNPTLTFPEHSNVYISNLIGLGILKEYAQIANDPRYKEIILRIESFGQTFAGKTQEYKFGTFDFTEYGKLFLKCCIKE